MKWSRRRKSRSVANRWPTWCGEPETTLGKKISRSTVWRMLHEAAIKPWQYEHWIFPRDPRFAEKAGPILDLYAGDWEGKPLGPKDYVLSMDEKTSIQARRRCHEEMPPEPEQTPADRAGIRAEGGVAILGGVGRASRHGPGAMRGEDGDQAVWPAGGSGVGAGALRRGGAVVFHRGQWFVASWQTSVERMRRRDKRIILVHTPVHASWLNQVEIYFSIIQRKVLTPNDFANLDAVRVRLALYEELSNRTPKPFAWKFTRQDMLDWLKRASPHFLAASAA